MDLLELERQVMAAIAARDVAALGALITDDFVLRQPGQPPTDRATFLAGVLAIPGEILGVAGEDVHARIDGSAGDVGMLTGIQRARIRLPDGTIVDDAGAFADLCVRGADGRWRMSAAFNVALPSP